LKAVMLAAQAIKAGDANIVVAGGMESMSGAPHLLMGARKGYKYGDQTAVDSLIRDGLWCAFENCAMGDSAEYIAAKCGVSRAEQDRFAAESHKKAAAAWDRGDFNHEVVPVVLPKKTITRDEGIRSDSSAEGLAKLRPAFKPDGTVTAGNASQLSDGSAACVVASIAAAESLGVRPLARIASYATSGVAPKEIFIAPVAAMNMALEKAQLRLEDVDLIELNEAFAAQMLACGTGLNWDESKVNVNGGGIALGHPIGASGARVLVTLTHALHVRNRRWGLASLCLGGGNAVAMVIERL